MTRCPTMTSVPWLMIVQCENEIAHLGPHNAWLYDPLGRQVGVAWMTRPSREEDE